MATQETSWLNGDLNLDLPVGSQSTTVRASLGEAACTGPVPPDKSSNL